MARLQAPINPELLALLACPRDHASLAIDGDELCCPSGHRYPLVDGIPVFLLAEFPQTIRCAVASLQAAQTGTGGPLYIETLALSAAAKQSVKNDIARGAAIDPVIAWLIGNTSGLGYRHLIGRLPCYPIPDIPLGPGNGDLLLDIGCNWGRCRRRAKAGMSSASTRPSARSWRPADLRFCKT
jgi:uncharacterized protein YbaR (Trm112 family)